MRLVFGVGICGVCVRYVSARLCLSVFVFTDISCLKLKLLFSMVHSLYNPCIADLKHFKSSGRIIMRQPFP